MDKVYCPTCGWHGPQGDCVVRSDEDSGDTHFLCPACTKIKWGGVALPVAHSEAL